MELVIDKDRLAAALALPCRMADRKSSIPLFSTVRLTVGDEGLSVDGTDAYRTARSTAKVSRGEPGAACISAAQLSTCVARLPAGDVRISAKTPTGVEIRAGASRLRIPSLPAEGWPQIATEPKSTIELPAKAVLEVLTARYCASQDHTRAHMFGVKLEVGGGKIRGLAVDGHRFASHEADGGPKASSSVFIPGTSLGDLVTLLEGGETALWGAAAGRVWWICGTTSISYALPDDAFPPHEKLVREEENVARVDRGRFLTAIDVASLVTAGRGAQKEKAGDCIRMSVADGKMRVAASDPDLGEAEDTFDVDAGFETADPIGVSAHYLRQAVAAQVDDEIVIDLGDPLASIQIRGTGRFAIVMPARV